MTGGRVAVRTVDIRAPVGDLTDLGEYDRVRIYTLSEGEVLGFAEIATWGDSVSSRRIRAALSDALDIKILAAGSGMSEDKVVSLFTNALERDLTLEDGDGDDEPSPLVDSVSVSIVVATLDRPDDLRHCLTNLRSQDTNRQVEIVVVDNNPSSGAARTVLKDFPGVVLVEESRRGLAYARNAGILAAGGDLVVMTDDDVTAPPDWLEKLVSPFARHDVAVVTGNVLPLELETQAQRLFEIYGGLGRGFERKEADAAWFQRSRRVVPTWRLGASANAAFRSSLFTDPGVGLMLEALGPGMPSGVGEDTYLFYKVLKAGYTIVYEPSAYVWHRHRSNMDGLRRQLFDYSKGHVAYHLTTLLRDRDLRVLVYLGFRLPLGHARRIAARLRGRSQYPLRLSLLELKGNVTGPAALWRSLQRVKREGTSSQRPNNRVPD